MNKELMKQLGFGDHVAAVEAGNCPFCKQPVKQEDFKDELSRKEFTISGLCQACQDKTFKEPEEDELQ